MPKATSGGASNAWEQNEPAVEADAAASEAQGAEAVEAEEPAQAEAKAESEAPEQAAAPAEDTGPATGGLVTAEEAPVAIDPNDTPPLVLPRGWTSAHTPASAETAEAPGGLGLSPAPTPTDAETSEAG
jgi:hypothetical protein